MVIGWRHSYGIVTEVMDSRAMPGIVTELRDSDRVKG